MPSMLIAWGLAPPMRDGHAVHADTIGREGAIGGVVSHSLKPAFARPTVQIPGLVARTSTLRALVVDEA
jgi:hypothetical protein